MAASIASHFEKLKSQCLRKKESDFHAIGIKIKVYEIILKGIDLYFCVPFPLNQVRSIFTIIRIGQTLIMAVRCNVKKPKSVILHPKMKHSNNIR